MPKIRYLSVRFANTLLPEQLPLFRAAIIEATERQSSLFHNHKGELGVIYRYPLIQYKLLGGKAAILCLEQGTDDIHFLFQQRELALRIGQKTEAFTIEDIQLQYFDLQLSNKPQTYQIHRWQALNQENYKRYSQLATEVERLQLLEKLLTGHLLSFASGINWQVDAPIQIGITQRPEAQWFSYKKQKTLCFQFHFQSNLLLPPHIGLGKGVSVGFGVVEPK